jgi:hypothetical protein
MHRFVSVPAVNLRREPRVDSDTLIGPLYLGQLVTDLGGAPDGWHHVSANVDGVGVADGFLVQSLPKSKVGWNAPDQPTLRDAVDPAREALAAAAVDQWVRFKRGAGKEGEAPYSGYINQMWKAFGKSYAKYDGKTDVPWSAVAISLMVRTAATQFPGYKQFKESIGHAKYMWDAIKANASGNTAAPFWGVRLDVAKPKVGDIIGNWRGTPRSYDDFLNATENPETPSHSDIVVCVGPQIAWAIGGNVNNSVTATGYQLSPDGFLLVNQRISPPGSHHVVGEAIVLMDNRVG